MQVRVELSTRRLAVTLSGEPLLAGQLYGDIKADASTWFVDTDTTVLEVSMLKRSRKGSYGVGRTNADTFWFSLFSGAPPADRIPLDYPPKEYYWSAYEEDDLPPVPRALPHAKAAALKALPAPQAAASNV